MKMVHLLMFLLAVTFYSPAWAEQAGSEFTYQGELNFQNEKANGYFDFSFRLHDDPTGSGGSTGVVLKPSVLVSNGIFTVELDFGSVPFSTGQQKWLEIAVRQTGSAEAHTLLTPLQKLSASIYALFSLQKEKEYGNLVVDGDGQIIGTYYGGRALTHQHYWIPYYSNYGLISTWWTFYSSPDCTGQPYQVTDNFNSNGQVFRVYSESNGYQLSYVHRNAEPEMVNVHSAMETNLLTGGPCTSRNTTQEFFPVLPNDPAVTGAPNDRGTLEFPYPQPITVLERKY